MKRTSYGGSGWGIAAVVVVAVGLAGGAAAQNSSGVRCLGRYWYSAPQDVAVQAEYAYVADYEAGMRVLDVSNAADPQEVALLNLPWAVEEIKLYRDHAFLLAQGAGLIAVDISNPGEPQWTGEIRLPKYNGGLEIVGGLAFISCTSDSSLKIIDISDPASMRLIGQFDASSPVGPSAVYGGRVYLTTEDGLDLIDIAHPESPQLILRLDCEPGEFKCITISQGLAFIGQLTQEGIIAGVGIYDPDNPDPPYDPIEMGYCDLRDGITNIIVKDSICYAQGGNGLYAIDFNDMNHPALVGTYNKSGYARLFTSYRLYTADQFYGIGIYDVRDSIAPRELGRWNNCAEVYSITLNNRYAYVGTDKGLATFDVANTAHPGLVDNLQMEGRTSGMLLRDNILYGTSERGMTIWDVGSPVAPRVLGQCDSVRAARQMEISGDFAYVASDHWDEDGYPMYGLYVVNVHNPTAPQIVFAGDSLTENFAVAVTGNTMLLLGIDPHHGNLDLVTYDISNPVSPQPIGQLGPLNFETSCLVNGNYAYLGGQSLYVMDISSPAEPEIVAERQVDKSCKVVAIEGNYLYASCADTVNAGYIDVLNISNPANPYKVGFYSRPYFVDDLAERWGVVYMVRWPGEFGIYDCAGALPVIERAEPSAPEKFALLPGFPNPFNSTTELSYSLPQTAKVTLGIFDVQGREVRKLIDFNQNAGTYKVRLEAGDLPAGEYYARLSAANFSAAQKVVLVK